MFPLVLLSPILALNPVWTSKEIYITWSYKGPGYEYVVEVYTDKDYSQLYMETSPMTHSSTFITFYETDLYFARTRYYNEATGDFGYMYWGQFYINLEYGIYSEDIVELPPPEEEQEPEVTGPEIEEEPKLPEVIQVDVEEKEIEKKGYVLPEDVDMREEIVVKKENILGVKDEKPKEVCDIFIFREKGKTDASFTCDLGVEVTGVEYIDWGEYLSLEVKGKYFDEIEGNVRIYDVKEFSVLDPSTWFGYKKVLTDTYKGTLHLRYVGYIQVDGVEQPNSTWGFGDTTFFVRNIYSKDISRRDVNLRLEVSSYVKGKEWIDFLSFVSKFVRVNKPQKVQSNKPFSFPFEKYIGVTQWHGCTAYQCPHKGIDFGAYKNRVLSIGDGKVVSTGYDKYGGECFQGGRYVIVKHTNGMHSTYFHLDSYSVKVGDTVKKGSIIGVSGNSGKWNCQRLGYHLHFETRKNRYSSSHVNPVEYINADWSKIPTLGYTTYRGRLTGDNPHPNY